MTFCVDAIRSFAFISTRKNVSFLVVFLSSLLLELMMLRETGTALGWLEG